MTFLERLRSSSGARGLLCVAMISSVFARPSTVALRASCRVLPAFHRHWRLSMAWMSSARTFLWKEKPNVPDTLMKDGVAGCAAAPESWPVHHTMLAMTGFKADPPGMVSWVVVMILTTTPALCWPDSYGVGCVGSRWSLGAPLGSDGIGPGPCTLNAH